MSKKITLDEAQIAQVEALSAYLPINRIADYFGFSETTFHEIKKRQPEVLVAYNRGVAKACSYVGSTLMGFIREKENTATKLNATMFYLRTKGGWGSENKNDNKPVCLTFSGEQTPAEILNIGFNALQEGKIDFTQMQQIGSLALTKMNIESRTQEDKAVSEQMSIDEAKAFAKELEQALANIEFFEKNTKSSQEYEDFLKSFKRTDISLGTVYHMIRQHNPMFGKQQEEKEWHQIRTELYNKYCSQFLQRFHMKGFKDFLTESKMTFDQAREILDLTGGFTPEDVKLAYKKMSAKHHPDKGGDVEMMKKVNLAYDLLKSKSGGAIKNTVDWDEIDRIYKELDAKVRLDLASKFKPDVFVKYFSEFYKQAFSYEIKWSEGRSSSPSFTWFQAKFHNQDKSIAFDLTVSVYLTNLRQKNTSLSVNPDISYPMNIETVGYANMKKQKMGKKDWDYKTNHSILYTPNKLFPEAKMTKIAAEVGSEIGRAHV